MMIPSYLEISPRVDRRNVSFPSTVLTRYWEEFKTKRFDPVVHLFGKYLLVHLGTKYIAFCVQRLCVR